MMWRNGFVVAVLLTLASACTKHAPAPTTPEAALENYVQTAFHIQSVADWEKLRDLSTGEARDWLAAMSEADFKKQFVDSGMQLISFKTKDTRQEPGGDVNLIYELAYKDGKTPNSAAYTMKKIAYLTKDDKGLWKIKATKNVKTFVERKDDLEVMAPASPETSSKEPATEQK